MFKMSVWLFGSYSSGHSRSVLVMKHDPAGYSSYSEFSERERKDKRGIVSVKDVETI